MHLERVHRGSREDVGGLDALKPMTVDGTNDVAQLELATGCRGRARPDLSDPVDLRDGGEMVGR